MRNEKGLRNTGESDKSNWINDADYRIKNRKWLRYSSNIARRVLAAIEDKPKFSQAELARRLNVSPQRISDIVKGQENLTLQTISQLSEVLDTEFIAFPEYKYSKPVSSFISVDTATVYTSSQHRSENKNQIDNKLASLKQAILGFDTQGSIAQVEQEFVFIPIKATNEVYAYAS